MSNKKTRYFVAISSAVLVVGLGAGLTASYMGMPAVFSRAAGPEELQYVPADAAVVAYANVRDVMNSEFRQRFKSLEPSQEHKNEFEEKTGLNFEQDVDSVTAAVMPKDGMANNPAGSFLVLARARYQPARLEQLALEHGAQIIDYNGKRIITASEQNAAGDRHHEDIAFGFVEADLVSFGSLNTVKASIDAHATNHNVVSNNDMMKLVNDIENANAWAVGRFDAIANKAGLPVDALVQMPQITWFSAAGHINGGLSGSFKAETKDEATAKNLRDVMNGFVAMARMQAGNKPGMQQLVDSLQITGDGNNVAIAFNIPSEVLDVLEGMAKGHVGAPKQQMN